MRKISLKVGKLSIANNFLIVKSEIRFSRKDDILPVDRLNNPLRFHIHSTLAGLAMNCKYSRTNRDTKKIEQQNNPNEMRYIYEEKKILFFCQ